MTLATPLDLISLALRTSGAIGVGQTPLSEDTTDAFDILNTILSEWQLNRWLASDLIEVSHVSTGAQSYTVGPTGTFVVTGQRPDKIDSAYATPLQVPTIDDLFLWPFASREGYDRVAKKTATGIPVSYFYDAGLGTNGTIYFTPIPSSSYLLYINCKANLGQFTALNQTITLPKPYITALLWNLSAQLRPIYQLPDDPQITARAAASLQTLINSIAQVPTVTTPTPANRAGIFSTTGTAA